MKAFKQETHGVVTKGPCASPAQFLQLNLLKLPCSASSATPSHVCGNNYGRAQPQPCLRFRFAILGQDCMEMRGACDPSSPLGNSRSLCLRRPRHGYSNIARVVHERNIFMLTLFWPAAAAASSLQTCMCEDACRLAAWESLLALLVCADAGVRRWTKTHLPALDLVEQLILSGRASKQRGPHLSAQGPQRQDFRGVRSRACCGKRHLTRRAQAQRTRAFGQVSAEHVSPEYCLEVLQLGRQLALRQAAATNLSSLNQGPFNQIPLGTCA